MVEDKGKLNVVFRNIPGATYTFRCSRVQLSVSVAIPAPSEAELLASALPAAVFSPVIMEFAVSLPLPVHYDSLARKDTLALVSVTVEISQDGEASKTV